MDKATWSAVVAFAAFGEAVGLRPDDLRASREQILGELACRANARPLRPKSIKQAWRAYRIGRALALTHEAHPTWSKGGVRRELIGRPELGLRVTTEKRLRAYAPLAPLAGESDAEWRLLPQPASRVRIRVGNGRWRSGSPGRLYARGVARLLARDAARSPSTVPGRPSSGRRTARQVGLG